MSSELSPIARGSNTEPGRTLCYCNNVTVAEFAHEVRCAAEDGFETILNRTKVGSRCTACLLDAEYFFVEALKRTTVSPSRKSKSSVDSVPLRRKLWHWIDKYLPLSPYPLYDVSPVLRGPELASSIAVANDRFMYRGELVAPPLELNWSVFDSAGRVCKTGKTVVEPDQAITIPASSWLPVETTETGLTVGSVRVARRFLTPGVRGTTRPQIVIETSQGCCAVHVQAPNGVGNYEFNLLSRADSERVFITFLNADDRELSFRGTLDVLNGSEMLNQWDSGKTNIPKRNAQIFEVNTGDMKGEDGYALQAFLRWNATGIHKAHVFCASPELDQFSVDHP